MSNIAHLFDSVKMEFPLGIRKVFRRLDTGREHDNLAAEILAGGNVSAALYLTSIGLETKKYEMVSERKLSAFYGVEQNYIHNVATRLRVGARRTPQLVLFRDGDRFYSPAMALALVPVMVFGRKIPKDSPAKAVYEGLRKSTYYDLLQQRMKMVNGKAPDPVPVQETPAPLSNMTPEVLSSVIAAAMKAALLEVMSESEPGKRVLQPAAELKSEKETAKPEPAEAENEYITTKHGARRRPLGWWKSHKPENWDEIKSHVETGAISQKAGALAVGMPVSVFVSYYYGRRDFLV